MPTINDIARKCGINKSTVSRVLNNTPGKVSAETRERVIQVMREMSYRPSNIARSLSSGRTYTLGVLVAHITAFFHSEDMLVGASEVARERGYQLQLSFYQHDLAGSLESAIHDLMKHKLDGILSIPSRSSDEPDLADALAGAGYPFAMAYYGASKGNLADIVVVDQRQGVYLATEYLLKRGRRRIAFAGGVQKMAASRIRLDGWRSALRDWGIDSDDSKIVYQGLGADGGMRTVQALADSGRAMPDAIVAFDDGLASGVLRGLKRRGLTVPDDVAVVGFNDVQLVCDACDPPLTSIKMPMAEVGRLSAKLLIDRLENDDGWKAQSVALPCTLIERESA